MYLPRPVAVLDPDTQDDTIPSDVTDSAVEASSNDADEE